MNDEKKIIPTMREKKKQEIKNKNKNKIINNWRTELNKDNVTIFVQ